jgi:hypothetical protein
LLSLLSIVSRLIRESANLARFKTSKSTPFLVRIVSKEHSSVDTINAKVIHRSDRRYTPEISFKTNLKTIKTHFKCLYYTRIEDSTAVFGRWKMTSSHYDVIIQAVMESCWVVDSRAIKAFEMRLNRLQIRFKRYFWCIPSIWTMYYLRIYRVDRTVFFWNDSDEKWSRFRRSKRRKVSTFTYKPIDNWKGKV